MKYILQLDSRSKHDDDLKKKYAALMDVWKTIPGPWGLKDKDIKPAPKRGSGFALSKLLGKGIRCQIYFDEMRGYDGRDTANHDDFLCFEFNPEKVEFSDFVLNIVPQLIPAFDTYWIKLIDDDMRHIDSSFWGENTTNRLPWQLNRKGLRKGGIYRMSTVSFYDRKLCELTFGFSPEKVISLIRSHVERAEIIYDGVYIVACSKPLSLLEHDALCWKLKEILIPKALWDHPLPKPIPQGV